MLLVDDGTTLVAVVTGIGWGDAATAVDNWAALDFSELIAAALELATLGGNRVFANGVALTLSRRGSPDILDFNRAPVESAVVAVLFKTEYTSL